MLIRATWSSSAAERRPALGWSTATVHILHSRWAKEGDAVLNCGSRWSSAPVPEHRTGTRLVVPFVNRRQPEGMLTVTEIQRGLRSADRPPRLPPSTIHRLLDRHGWRVVPRPGIPPTGAARPRLKTAPERYATRSFASLSRGHCRPADVPGRGALRPSGHPVPVLRQDGCVRSSAPPGAQISFTPSAPSAHPMA